MSRRKWRVLKPDKELAARLASEHSLYSFAALIASSRGITADEDVDAFFGGEVNIEDPFVYADMEKAAEVVSAAIENFERIAVYGDYDADGVTATALLFSYLEGQGADAVYYIPERSEGYGINKAAIDKLHENSVKLIITVDCGINSVEEAEYIKSLGMRLVVTDHHLPGDILPDCEAVVDPHRSDCPSTFKELAGVGVAFKLVWALEGCELEEILESCADILAIGTVGDVMPLKGENRYFVRHGAAMINEGERPGIAALKNVSGAAHKSINGSAIAYTLVPRLNAAGRMGSPMRAMNLLINSDPDTCSDIASEIDRANAERHSTEAEILSQVLSRLEKEPMLRYDRILVVEGEGWQTGVVGIVAAKLVDMFGKPAIVISCDGDMARGSGRSCGGFSMYEAIKSCSELLEHFGGHTLAAGLGLKTPDIPQFRKMINAYAAKAEMPTPELTIDCRINPAFINNELLTALATMEPFGAGNPTPIFGLFATRLEAIQPVSDGKHLRITLSKNTARVTAMCFGTSEKSFPYIVGDTLDVAATVEPNEYMGEIRPSIHIKAIRFSGTDDDAVIAAMKLFEKIKRGEPLTNEEKLSALPSRAETAEVYRLIRTNGGWQSDAESICGRLGDNGQKLCRVMVSLDALTELGVLLQDKTGAWTLPDNPSKTELDKSSVFLRLK